MNQTSNNENKKLLFALITCLTLIVLTMIVSIFFATRRPIVVVVPGGGFDTGAAEMLPAPLATGSAAVADAAPLPEVNVVRQSRLPSVDNPLDPLWAQVAPVNVVLEAQQVAEPMLPRATVTAVEVQAVRDDNRFLWRLSWEQEEPSFESDFAQFSDAVAIQFPLADGAPYTMGGPDMPVSIQYWRAIWQKDVDDGFYDTTVSNPNAYNDFYWFASETGPYSADRLAAGDPTAMQWMIPVKSGNPMADFERKCPMEEITSHGFGTTTHVSKSASSVQGTARGQWHDGRWYVVFERQVNQSDLLLARFNDNPQQQLIAFAVWDGSAENRGGQKSISNWIPMRINP